MRIFGTKKLSPPDAVKCMSDGLAQLIECKGKEGDKEKIKKKALEDISKSMASLKSAFLNTEEEDQNPEIVAQACHEIYKTPLLPNLFKSLELIDFETRKDAVFLVGFLLTRKVGVRMPTVDYIFTTPETTIFPLIDSYTILDISLSVGMLLRECIKYEELCKIILYSNHLYKLFSYIESSAFDIASDSFSTLKDLLTKHRKVVSTFLTTEYDKFFITYNSLLQSENYVTKRQSAKLLGEVLLDRVNASIMKKYVSQPENLKIAMNLLRDKSPNVQFEGFHIFKIFIANPVKAKPIVDIIMKNKERLVEFLSTFLNCRDKDDEQFADEKAYLIKAISDQVE